MRRHPERRELEQLELGERDWRRVLEAGRASGLAVIVEAHDLPSRDLALEAGVDALQSHPRDIDHPELLRGLAAAGRPLLLAAGDGGEPLLRDALEAAAGSVAILLGPATAPAPVEELRLSEIASVRERLRVSVGLLDPTDGGSAFALLVPALAAAEGAAFVEKRLVLDRSRKGRDGAAALSPEEFYRMVELLRQSERARGEGASPRDPASAARGRSIVAAGLIGARRGAVRRPPALQASRRPPRPRAAALRGATGDRPPGGAADRGGRADQGGHAGMKALITGGAGFVGSHLAEALLARGDEVHVIDNLSTGSIENIEHLKAQPRFHYVIDTIMNEPVLAELVDRVDVVFHLAAAVGVRLIVESPVNTIETNVHGTELVLKLANKKRKKVLITSTSEVYGKATTTPVPRGRRPRAGADLEGPLELRLQQGHRRVPGARLPQGEAAAGRGGAALQHGRPAPDRPLRDGDPELREAGAARPPAHGLRRRHADGAASAT